MTTVIISDGSSYKENQALPQTYHYIGSGCANLTKISEQNRVLVDEDLAIKFGRHACNTCIKSIERSKALASFEELVELYTGGIQGLLYDLPENFELRLYVHGYNQQPMKIWSSRGIDE